VRTLRPRVVAIGLLGVAVGLGLSGCAGRRITDGVFRSTKGYRVTVPGPDWAVVDSSRADLELRHRDGSAGMLVNALCEGGVTRRPANALAQQLLAGLRGREIVERVEVAVNGRTGTRMVVEALPAGPGSRVRIESVTVADARCVYDLIYAAPAAAFAGQHADFAQFVASFVRE
jgi:hypothetical protein